MHDLTERVRYLVERTANSHREFAGSVGMEPSKLSKALAGTRRFQPAELATIAEVTRVSLEWLIHGGGPTPPLRGRRDRKRERPVAVANRDTARREEILEATWRLIAHLGYYRIRVADIAASCGTSPAAVHYYFPSKGELLQTALLHCAERAFDRQTAQLAAIEDPEERLFHLIELQLPVPGQVRDEWMIWLQLSSETSLRPELRSVHNDFHVRWRAIVAETVRDGQRQDVFADVAPEQVAVSFMALADGLAIQMLTATPHNSARTMRDLLVDFAERTILR